MVWQKELKMKFQFTLVLDIHPFFRYKAQCVVHGLRILFVFVVLDNKVQEFLLIMPELSFLTSCLIMLTCSCWLFIPIFWNYIWESLSMCLSYSCMITLRILIMFIWYWNTVVMENWIDTYGKKHSPRMKVHVYNVHDTVPNVSSSICYLLVAVCN